MDPVAALSVRVSTERQVEMQTREQQVALLQMWTSTAGSCGRRTVLGMRVSAGRAATARR